jgi:hypothetical protein
MSTPDAFDYERAHRYLSADCFNRCWDLIDKPQRTPEEDEQMLLRTMASFWHWTQRPDLTPRNRSVGYWQIARVYALLGQADNARRYGEISLRFSEQEPPFFLAYAHEALARAAMVAGDRDQQAHHLERARALCPAIQDAESRELLEKDLATIR